MSEPLRAAGQAVAEAGTGHPGRRGRPLLAFVALASLALYALDTILVTAQPLVFFDLPVAQVVQSANWGPLVPVMELTNAIAGYRQAVLGAAAVLLLLLLDRRAGGLMALGSLASVFDQLMKAMVVRHRPTPDLVTILDPAKGYSYPSGHAVFYTWLAFMLAAALAPRLAPWLRAAVWAAAGLLVFTACAGRVWAGVHWPSDVAGGFLGALSWSAFVLWVPERWLPSPAVVWRRWRDRGRPVAV